MNGLIELLPTMEVDRALEDGSLLHPEWSMSKIRARGGWGIARQAVWQAELAMGHHPATFTGSLSPFSLGSVWHTSLKATL